MGEPLGKPVWGYIRDTIQKSLNSAYNTDASCDYYYMQQLIIIDEVELIDDAIFDELITNKYSTLGDRLFTAGLTTNKAWL